MTSLEPLPWQREVWEGLTDRLQRERLPHALLFTGTPGLGKRHLVRAFAQASLCESPGEQAVACGQCRSCKLFAAGTHPDFLLLQPEEAGKSIPIAQIRALADYTALKSQYGRRKVVIIEPAEAMNVNAANALLKTLEEPAAQTLLLLVSDRPSALLATIRSRCQNITLHSPPPDVAIDWLQTQGVERERAGIVLALAGGSPLTALAEGETLELRDQLLADLEATRAGQADPVSVAAQWQGDARQILPRLYGLLGDLIRLGSGGSVTGLHNPDLAPRLQALADAVDLEHLFRQLDGLQEALRLIGGSANPQLLLEEWLIGWTRRPRNRRAAGQ